MQLSLYQITLPFYIQYTNKSYKIWKRNFNYKFLNFYIFFDILEDRNKI